MSKPIKRFIFTGTPGSGKTSVILELEKLGYASIHESATDVIAKEQAQGNMCPWEEPNFADKIVRMQKVRQMNSAGELQFYDRSPFCTYSLGQYLSQWKNTPYVPSPILLEEIDRCLKTKVYQNQVFFFENLGFIEPTDARTISYEDAIIFEQIHLHVYKEFGFEIVLVPKKSIAERCKFILTAIGIEK